MRHIAIILTTTLLFLALVAPCPAMAGEQGGTGAQASGGTGGGEDFTSAIVKKFETSAQAWETAFKDKALKVFWALAAVALIVKFMPIVASGGSRDFGDFAREMVMFVFTTMALYYCVVNAPALFRSLVDFFSQTAVQASGGDASPHRIFSAALNAFALTAQAINKGVAYTTQTISNTLTNENESIVGALSQSLQLAFRGLVNFFIGAFGLVAIAVAVVLAGAIAIKYAIVLCASYIVAYAGIIILGFCGWGFTRDVIISYFKAAAGLGIQLMCFILLVNIGLPLIEDFAKSFNADPHAYRIQDFITFLATMVMWYLLTDSVPPMVAQICGAPSLHTPGAGAIAGGALALAGAGAGVVADSAKSGGAAAKAAFASAKSNGAGTGKAVMSAALSGLGGAASAANHNSGNSVTAALKTAAQGGSFGSVMASAMENSAKHSGSVKESQKQAQEEQKQAKRDETQGQIAQSLTSIAASMAPADKSPSNTPPPDGGAPGGADSGKESGADNGGGSARGGMTGENQSSGGPNSINVQPIPQNGSGSAQSSGVEAPAATSSAPRRSLFQRIFNRGKGETAAQRAAEEKFFHTNDNVQKPTDE